MSETAKKVHIIDKEKTKAVIKKVNRNFQKKDEWSFMPVIYLDFIKLSGKILFIPVVLIMAVMEGIRAGIIAGAQKTLLLYR